MFELKFYADKYQKYTNKYFCFKGYPLDLEVIIYLFVSRGNIIRACFISDLETGRNERIENDELNRISLNIAHSIKNGNIEVKASYYSVLERLKSKRICVKNLC